MLSVDLHNESSSTLLFKCDLTEVFNSISEEISYLKSVFLSEVEAQAKKENPFDVSFKYNFYDRNSKELFITVSGKNILRNKTEVELLTGLHISKSTAKFLTLYDKTSSESKSLSKYNPKLKNVLEPEFDHDKVAILVRKEGETKNFLSDKLSFFLIPMMNNSKIDLAKVECEEGYLFIMQRGPRGKQIDLQKLSFIPKSKDVIIYSGKHNYQGVSTVREKPQPVITLSRTKDTRSSMIFNYPENIRSFNLENGYNFLASMQANEKISFDIDKDKCAITITRGKKGEGLYFSQLEVDLRLKMGIRQRNKG